MKNREILQKNLESKINDLKDNIEDKTFADSAINDILEIKSQLDVEPTEVHIETKDVIKEYNFGAYRFTRTKNEIIFSTNGFKVIIKPWVASLYNVASYVLDLKDNENDLSDEEKNVLEVFPTRLASILFFPTTVFLDDEYMMDCFKFITERSAEMVDKIMKKQAEAENEAESNSFVEAIKTMDEN